MSCWQSCSSLKMNVLGVVMSNCLKMERSSAYFVSVKLLLCKGALTSLKKMFQRHGPRTVPWNTMLEREKDREKVPWTSTVAVRAER